MTLTKTIPPPDRLAIRVVESSAHSTLADDVRCGLLAMPKWLPPKYFYDRHGSWLFERICETPEYYPTRIERQLLTDVAAQIIQATAAETLVELGSGSAEKTELLLAPMASQSGRRHYVPIDVCEPVMIESGNRLIRKYPALEVRALVGDYYACLEQLPARDGPCLFAFLGGSIGNFETTEAVDCIQKIRAAMNPGDHFLLGADRIKDQSVLDAAYNDAQGFTARFNLNVLRVLNRELEGDFNLSRFVHEAFYDVDRRRIEMHLRATEPHTVHLSTLDERVEFERGETVLTEISRKFLADDLENLVADGGLTVTHHFEAPQAYFSLVLAQRSKV